MLQNQATKLFKKVSTYQLAVSKKDQILTEDQLIKGCIRQESSAQKALFDLYAGKMLGVCQRYARNDADAEDILQDAFIKIFDKIKQFKSEGSFEGWIRRIVVNTALKKYTLSRYSKEISLEDYAKSDNRIDSDPIAIDHLSEKDLLQLINSLPDGYRLVFNLYVIEGYRHEEISEMLGIQSGTSRSQLAKARNLLQKQILALQKVAV